MLNPLFPAENNEDDAEEQGIDPFQSVKRHKNVIEPLHKDLNPAANLIREKLDKIYAQEPSAKEELKEVKAEKPVSRHQKFMAELSTSGRGLAEIQTAWHNYYVDLPDHEKHEVWQEFYASNAKNEHFQHFSKPETTEQKEKGKPDEKGVVVAEHLPSEPTPVRPRHERGKQLPRSAADIKKQIRKTVTANGQLKAKHHLQSLLFGIGIGAVVLIVTLFSFFNEYIIAPFIQPSRQVSATPIIMGTNAIAPSNTPEVIIPKINVEIPLDFSVTSTSENQIENALEGGVVHYPTTVRPGEKGNTAFFGHSSNNIFNPGKYKFAFVLLHNLVPGDTFYLTYNSKVYAYQVYDKQIVEPSDVNVLNNVPGQIATATLITCDPPGTSLHRLVVWGRQVNPDPATNASSASNPAATTPTALPDNGPTLWNRLVTNITNLF
jgi:LPXTG-site transpeptidase (sortase) family protein